MNIVAYSEKRQKFYFLIKKLCGFPLNSLVDVLRSKEQYSPLLRAAALRNLIVDAPIEVTKGQPYLAKRKLVRSHYGV